jgi:hypothetical protein
MNHPNRSTAMSTDSTDLKLENPAPAGQNPPEPAFGWTQYAEQINGRFAMVGFIVLLMLEFFTKQDLFTWLGLR